jgi:ubiquinone/menaquinone biosynthesis C-methylase UbiE
MERIPEKELMDDKVQAEAYAKTDFSEPHDAFISHFRSRFPDFSRGLVLDLGCGPADVTLRFAQAFPETNIIGIDGAQTMLSLGLKEIRLKKLAHRVKLEICVLPDAGLLERRFDAVISNSLLHHLADPSVMWQIMYRCADPLTPIFVMDLMRPDSVEKADSLVKLYASDTPIQLREDFYSSLLAAYTVRVGHKQLRWITK